jgi:integrase
MAKRTFTETWIRNLKPPAKGYVPYKETGRRGFLLRSYTGGTKAFFYQYSWRGKSEFLKLREWSEGSNSLALAHKEHAAALDQYIHGINPKDERERETKAREVREQHEHAERGITARNVIAEWAWHYARRHRKRPREAVRLLRTYLKPWAGKPARDLVKRDAVLLLDRITARGSLVMANRIRDLANQAFNFAIERDLIENNPFAGVRKPGGAEKAKERALTADEIKLFWCALDSKSDDIEISPKWSIPAERSKNGKAHEVPLSDLAVEILTQMRALGKDEPRPCIAPSWQSNIKPDEPLSERALSRALRNNHDADGKLFGLPAFTPHDLRRSAATQMTQLGIARLHVAKLLNHADSEITSVYDRSDYASEKRTALQRWSDELRLIIAGKKRKVVPIRSGAAA